ncbi:hypothetical protein DAPPUDRAFT_319685 [Daphnia pulex]|uniref:Fatty acid hydroxylase domain-containing protein n=1 Tax=Daphnia pulex TaxID=6669 RepID=E9GMH7_DAPPU|nr:hypothetical protein DAPPUDRAFT_319685 [Daphnia pulex]|eukprot:EFX79387.1 hypothetical protein DAPPUDRAFT_319685 [Daphnia pulex]
MEAKRMAGWCGFLVLFVSTLFLIVPVFYGHTLTTLMQQFRAVVGVAAESKWITFLQLVGTDDWNLYVWGIVLSIQIPFWSVGILFAFLDYYNWPKWIMRYKIQPGTNEPVDLNKLTETIRVVLVNQWVIAFPLLIASYYFQKMINRMPEIQELPTVEHTLIDFLVLFICEEVGVYYVHRLIHHPKLYIRVHKKHHEWRAPVAIASMYCTGTEYFLLLSAAAMGPLLMNPHIITQWVWYAFVQLRSVNEHTGYEFPWLPSAEHHNYHHIMSNACYSHSYFLDWLHGTDKGFRSYIRKKSHIK